LETVAMAKQLAPDVVILDFAMPVMNGIDAAREILKTHPKTEIVLCSMYLDSQLAAVASGVGIRSLLSKSNVGKVVDGVEAALRGESFHESKI